MGPGFKALVEDRLNGRTNIQEARGGVVDPPPQSMIDIEAAIKEVSSIGHDVIEVQTATKWAARAIACYTLALRSPNTVEMYKWLIDGEDYYNEAVEHAAKTPQGPQLVANLKRMIEAERSKVMELVR